MPNQFQPFNLNTDITSTKTLLHEAIPLTGTIYKFGTGSYIEENIKNFSHGQFQSIYDYPYLSSSANHIFDLAVGYDETSVLSASTSIQNAKKINMYNQMTQVLLGYSKDTGEVVHKFEADLNIHDDDAYMKEVFFINLSRLITKDQIKKGSFSMKVATGSWADATTAGDVITLTDTSASADSQTATVLGGDYGLLYQQGPTKEPTVYGLVFYQAGVLVLTASLFQADADRGQIENQDFSAQIGDLVANAKTVRGALSSSTVSASCNALRHRICDISFNNTTEINSNIYFCRVPWNRFNYSTNPTYVSGAQIQVKNIGSDTPIAYVTTIGMYNSAGELLATAKLSEPLRKDPTNELTLRVRLDY